MTKISDSQERGLPICPRTSEALTLPELTEKYTVALRKTGKLEEENEKLKKEIERLRGLVNLDLKTGLLKFEVFKERLTSYFKYPVRQKAEDRTSAALWFIDLNQLKSLNDRYGYEVGDAAIMQLSTRLKEHTRSGEDLVARRGGDEFLVFVRGLPSERAFLDISLFTARFVEPPSGEVAEPYLEEFDVPKGRKKAPSLHQFLHGVQFSASVGIVAWEETRIRRTPAQAEKLGNEVLFLVSALMREAKKKIDAGQYRSKYREIHLGQGDFSCV